jgi:hypothetical protein
VRRTKGELGTRIAVVLVVGWDKERSDEGAPERLSLGELFRKSSIAK